MPILIIHGFTISLAPRTFRPALPVVLATLAALVCCTLVYAQIIDCTYILAVDRRVQEIDAAKDYGIRTQENEAFFVQMTDGGGVSPAQYTSSCVPISISSTLAWALMNRNTTRQSVSTLKAWSPWSLPVSGWVRRSGVNGSLANCSSASQNRCFNRASVLMRFL